MRNRFRLHLILFLIFVQFFVMTGTGEALQIIRRPTRGRIYHGDFPGFLTASQTQISIASQQSYVQTVGKSVAWVYFSNDWFRGDHFPLKTATWVRNRGAVPYIRLNMRSSANGLPEPVYTLERIARGDFDGDLRRWARAARDFNYPLMVEYGFEMNGRWEPWNGFWNGRSIRSGGNPSIPLGAARFVAAYRHVVNLMREEGAHNITWVFHANDRNNPDDKWNQLQWYYPGADVVDWVGVSVYGPQTSAEPYDAQFPEAMDVIYKRVLRLAPNKPVIVSEMGVVFGNPLINQANWTQRAFNHLIARRWPNVIGFTWWNNGEVNFMDTFRIQDHPALADVFRRRIAEEPRVLGRPIFTQSKR